jgi:DNA-binding transcriptional LysR family regulator
MDSGARLNLTQLATLLAFGRRGTLAAAAASLGYTSGAVSQHLAALERAVGASLVRKTGRTLVLTDAGHVLLEHADAVLRTEREAMRAVASVRDDIGGPLAVGTWGSTAATLLTPVFHRMATDFPRVIIRSQEVDLDDAAGDVLHGRVDVAFGLDYADAPLPRHDKISIIDLLQESFAIAMSRDDDSGVGPIRPGELGRHAWILPPASSQYGAAIRAGLRRSGVEPTVVHEVTDTAASLHLAAAGLGITVITPMMRILSAGLELRVRPMAEPMTRDVVLLVPAAHRPRPVTAFVDTARLVAAALSRSSE